MREEAAGVFRQREMRPGPDLKPCSSRTLAPVCGHEETRSILAEWLTGIRLCRTDQPIYPDRPGVSLTLRLAQVLLVAEKGDASAIGASATALFAEIDAQTDAEVRDHFEYLALAKLLINRSAAGLLPDWLGLLLKFDRLTNASPERRKLAARASRGAKGKPAPTPLGMLFILQMMGINSVAELAAVFDRLDPLSVKERARLFADVFDMPSDFALIVNRAWLEEHKRGNADWLACAARYHRMAGQAEAWGYRELALRCHVARGVMLDEYAEDPTSALAALDEAARQLGANPVLSRARAKILYRRKDHLGALQLLRDASPSTALNDPIERAIMLREAGIWHAAACKCQQHWPQCPW